MSSEPADQRIDPQDLQRAGGDGEWRLLGSGASAWYAAPSHAAGAALVRRVVELTRAQGVVVDLDLRATGVRVRLTMTPEDDGFRAAHLSVARAVSGAAAELGLHADPAAVQDVLLTLDVGDRERVSRFWQEALDYDPVGDEDLMHRTRRHVPIWLQDLDRPRPLRNRLHLDVVTPEPVARATLAALERLGAQPTRHGYYATVADAEGNEVDVLPLVEGADRWEGEGTEDWRLVFAAIACYPVADPRQAVQLAARVADLADRAGLPLGVDLRPGLVVIDTGKDRWETDPGYETLAADVQDAARELGLAADVSLPRFVQVGIDAVDIPAVRRFWCAALGYEPDARPDVTDIVDPRQLNVPFFLQRLDADDEARRAQRNRLHVDVYVPHDQFRLRVEAALAAGGRLVRDDPADDWVTLADPEGNEIDVAAYGMRKEQEQPTVA